MQLFTLGQYFGKKIPTVASDIHLATHQSTANAECIKIFAWKRYSDKMNLLEQDRARVSTINLSFWQPNCLWIRLIDAQWNLAQEKGFVIYNGNDDIKIIGPPQSTRKKLKNIFFYISFLSGEKS